MEEEHKFQCLIQGTTEGSRADFDQTRPLTTTSNSLTPLVLAADF
jgi:hypothetical protein